MLHPRPEVRSQTDFLKGMAIGNQMWPRMAMWKILWMQGFQSSAAWVYDHPVRLVYPSLSLYIST